MTRRRLLGSAAGVAGASAALSVLPPGLQRAVAAGVPRRGGLADVRHVVMLMQENRSFDHYFGTLAGVRGFGDPRAPRLPNGRSVFYQPDSRSADGYALPFHLDTTTTSAQAIPTLSHAWDVQHEAWNGGRMDRWLPAHRAADGGNGPLTMGYYTREDIPFHYALADAFTICDNYFCSVLGPTWSNRMYWMTGSIDPSGAYGGPVIDNVAPTPFRWKTYAEQLQDAGVSWKVYHNNPNNPYNMLSHFDSFQKATAGNPLHDLGTAPQTPGSTFEDDVANDRLPAVSWLLPTAATSEHPNHLPAAGADFVAGKIEAIASNPEVWAKTVFILNYDENDGLFDHVPPLTPPEGTPGEYVNGLPIGSGFRVPCVIVSPWTVGGWAASEPFDHTSVLQFLECFTGVRAANLTDWRRRTFGDMTSAFQFHTRPEQPPSLPATADQLALAQQEVATLPPPTAPGTGQSFPRQEPGHRRHTPDGPPPGRR
ncbi:alkaline phosphatase family protein [Streptomyces sp. NPDC047022]|uniref:alkaline phosphatase family protein n=1 Tax=Streptomyces sp. NPDC047022 TaxID=3155737 RepID=UPI0033FE8F2D